MQKNPRRPQRERGGEARRETPLSVSRVRAARQAHTRTHTLESASNESGPRGQNGFNNNHENAMKSDIFFLSPHILNCCLFIRLFMQIASNRDIALYFDFEFNFGSIFSFLSSMQC